MINNYEILIRFDTNTGSYKGAQARRYNTETKQLETPQAITEAEWPKVCASINTSLFQRIAELEAEVASRAAVNEGAVKGAVLAAQQRYDEMVIAAEKAIADGNVEALHEILAQAKDLTSDARAEAIARKRADLEAQLAAL